MPWYSQIPPSRAPFNCIIALCRAVHLAAYRKMPWAGRQSRTEHRKQEVRNISWWRSHCYHLVKPGSFPAVYGLVCKALKEEITVLSISQPPKLYHDSRNKLTIPFLYLHLANAQMILSSFFANLDSSSSFSWVDFVWAFGAVFSFLSHVSGWTVFATLLQLHVWWASVEGCNDHQYISLN